MFGGVAIFGRATLIFGLTQRVWVALAALSLMGTGTVAMFGLVPAIVLGGVVTLAVAVLWAKVFFPILWRLRTFQRLKDHETDGTSRTS